MSGYGGMALVRTDVPTRLIRVGPCARAQCRAVTGVPGSRGEWKAMIKMKSIMTIGVFDDNELLLPATMKNATVPMMT